MLYSAGSYEHKMQFYSFLSILFILLIPCVLIAANPEMQATPDLVVVYDRGMERIARQVQADYPDLRQELETIFQWPMKFRPTLVLVDDSTRFQQLAGHELVVAYALPAKNVAVVDYSMMNTSPFTLKATFKHELCHLMLHHNIKNNNLPRWLDEGICQWASDGLADIMLDHKRELLPAAVLSDQYLDLDSLEQQFPQNRNSLILAYEQSKSVVNYINREYGPESIRDLLGLLKQGYDIDTAVKRRLAISLDRLENQWRRHLTKKVNWFTYLSIHIYEILFVSAALLTVLGFVRKIIRQRKYSAAEDDDII
jgi:Peptidase MA superfamily